MPDAAEVGRAKAQAAHRAGLTAVVCAVRPGTVTKRHQPKTPPELRKMLLADGWAERSGKGDHKNFKKPGNPNLITLDMGVREMPIGTLRSIYRKTGWDW